MLDDFESLIQNSCLDRDFLDLWRSMNSMHEVVYVVASTEPLSVLEERWRGQWQEVESSPFFNIFFGQDLGPFSQDESRAFLQQRFQFARLSVPDLVVDLILHWAQGHPHCLQSAGAFIGDLLQGTRGEWDERMIQQLRDHFADFSQSDISPKK